MAKHRASHVHQDKSEKTKIRITHELTPKNMRPTIKEMANEDW